MQQTLDNIYIHLLHYIEQAFVTKFYLVSPSVNGIDEAIARIKASQLEGDFGDLSSNCNEHLLLSCIKTSCKMAGLSDLSLKYIEVLVTFVMRHSYFLEPSGTFRTMKGFSMSDCSTVRGSEIILRIYEFEIWKKFFFWGLKNNVNRFMFSTRH